MGYSIYNELSSRLLSIWRKKTYKWFIKVRKRNNKATKVDQNVLLCISIMSLYIVPLYKYRSFLLAIFRGSVNIHLALPARSSWICLYMAIVKMCQNSGFIRLWSPVLCAFPLSTFPPDGLLLQQLFWKYSIFFCETAILEFTFLSAFYPALYYDCSLIWRIHLDVFCLSNLRSKCIRL